MLRGQTAKGCWRPSELFVYDFYAGYVRFVPHGCQAILKSVSKQACGSTSRLEPWEKHLHMAHTHFHLYYPFSQGRCRICLLKSCNQAFSPLYAFARYCSQACVNLARRWSKWRAAMRYRSSERGKERRREQSRRYRQRRKIRQQAARQQETADAGAASASGDPSAQAGEPLQTYGEPCARPGCYCVFQPGKSPLKKFCSGECRQAVRVVHERERRLRIRGRPPRPRCVA